MKPLERCKQRLTTTLEPPKRQLLALWMLDRVAAAAMGNSALAATSILGGDARIQRLAQRRGLRWRADPAEELNQALNRFYFDRRDCQDSGMLFLAGDLPRLAGADIRGMVEAFAGADVVAAPGARGGTNALLVRTGRHFSFQLGAQSYERHRAHATELGLSWRQYDSPALFSDIDTRADLERLQEDEPTLWQMVASAAAEWTEPVG
jgi:2-phospho-L-lactate guanylyltransferase